MQIEFEVFGEFDRLKELFGRFGYELQHQPEEPNPFVVVATNPIRRILWRTRTQHTLWGLLRAIEFERDRV